MRQRAVKPTESGLPPGIERKRDDVVWQPHEQLRPAVAIQIGRGEGVDPEADLDGSGVEEVAECRCEGTAKRGVRREVLRARQGVLGGIRAAILRLVSHERAPAEKEEVEEQHGVDEFDGSIVVAIRRVGARKGVPTKKKNAESPHAVGEGDAAVRVDVASAKL